MGAEPRHDQLTVSRVPGETPVPQSSQPSTRPSARLALRRFDARVALALVLVGVLALASCGDASSDTAGFGGRVVRRTPGSVPATTVASDLDAKPPYPVSLTNLTCPFAAESSHGLKVECRTLEVPMNRAKPGGDTVKLAVAIIHSTSPTPRPDPVLYLEGGPGGSALSSIDEWTQPVSSILDEHDLILLDQRGTGYSLPQLRCTNLSDDDYAQNTSLKVEDCVHIIENVQGADLSSFNTTESAADIADLRRAMKIESWNLFGISYGTDLALWTMKTQPAGIRSVVIDSVYPPGANLFESIGTNLERAIHEVSTDCAAQPRCNAAYPDVEGQVRTAVAKLNTRREGQGDRWLNELFHALYISAVMPDIPKAVSLANQGRISDSLDYFHGKGAVQRHPEDYKDRPPTSAVNRPSMSEALYHSVVCAEAAPLTTPTAIRAAYGALPPEIGGALRDQYLSQMALCNAWSVPPKPLGDYSSDIPTLVLEGTYDPITPPAWGDIAASHLSKSTVVKVTGSGHAVWAFGPCPKQLITQFFDDPTAPGPDCTVGPPTFET